jgi:hypothetical protein
LVVAVLLLLVVIVAAGGRADAWAARSLAGVVVLVVQVVLFAGCGGVVVACSGVLEAAQARNHLPARRQAVARTRAGGVSFLAFQAVMPFKFLSLHRSGIAGTTTLLARLPDWHWGCSSAALLGVHACS